MHCLGNIPKGTEKMSGLWNIKAVNAYAYKINIEILRKVQSLISVYFSMCIISHSIDLLR